MRLAWKEVKRMQIKNKQMLIKGVDEETGVFEGYLSTYGNADREGDVIEKGAFDMSLSKKKKVPMCFNHDWNNVIGTMELSSDDKGLKAKGTLNMSDPEVMKIHSLMKMGALDSMSIGMMVKEYEPIDPKNPYWQWNIKEAEVWEGSIVTIPANEQATIDKVKSINKETEEKRHALQKQIEALQKKLGGKK